MFFAFKKLQILSRSKPPRDDPKNVPPGVEDEFKFIFYGQRENTILKEAHTFVMNC